MRRALGKRSCRRTSKGLLIFNCTQIEPPLVGLLFFGEGRGPRQKSLWRVQAANTLVVQPEIMIPAADCIRNGFDDETLEDSAPI
jgi:hypothetical protein